MCWLCVFQAGSAGCYAARTASYATIFLRCPCSTLQAPGGRTAVSNLIAGSSMHVQYSHFMERQNLNNDSYICSSLRIIKLY